MSESKYSKEFKDGDCFNKRELTPDVVVEYDTGNKLSEHNAQIAEEAKRALED